MVEVFATAEATERYAAWRGPPPAWAVVDDRALASLSDSVTPAGVVAVCRFLDTDLAALADARLVAICADVRDPGNAGTVIRTADAAGADARRAGRAAASTPTTPRRCARASAASSTYRWSSSPTYPPPSRPRGPPG